ncbi:Fic family protein [Thiocystis violacea]|uniref:Fic family protein n=1 Tax=Thiocystis violacea TaxID=13725 RepID=UPI001F5BF636|nr:Fic family protein [Thiocystis violacea]MBK1725108.1 cell filamentation protein Fic [Thiocystis violacea]
MSDFEADLKAAKHEDADTLVDRSERLSSMDPMRIAETSRHRVGLADMAVELAAHAAGFRRSLPEGVLTALADLVRAMNCYYSNLIEGHDTHPVDIERALKEDYSANAEQRNLQLEARAHIAVQQWIDDGGLSGRALTFEGIREVHKRFGELLPEALLWIEDPETGERVQVVPGALRSRDVRVGQHIAISPGALPRFLAHLERTYRGLGKAETIIAAAAAHHRLLWIHPFLDGNGRVARLMSHAMLLEALDTGGVWSIARGLARNVRPYKNHLAACDLPRQNDLDGRGHLSEESLAAFTRFFMETCLDQIKFMEELVQPKRLRDRILRWSEEEVRANTLPPKAGRILEALLYHGTLHRGEVPELLGASERNARRIVAALAEHGVIVSESTRAPLRLTFPAKLASRWMPGLFPETSYG